MVSAEERFSLDLAEIFAKCSALYYSGQTREGLELAVSGVQRARDSGNIAWLRRMLTAQGIFQADLHNLPQAFETFSEVVDLCAELKDATSSFSAWNNVSSTLAYAELPHLAISAAQIASEHASRIADEGTRELRRAEALANLSYGCLLAREYRSGLRACALACDLFDRHEDALGTLGDGIRANVLLVLTHRIRLLLRVGMLDEAKSWVARAVALSASTDRRAPQRAVLVVEMTCALADAYMGKFDRGVSRLLQLTESTASINPVLIADALRDLVEAHTIGNRADLASHYMRLLAKHMQEVRSERALFHHRRHVGWLAAISPAQSWKRRPLPAEANATNRIRGFPLTDRRRVLEDLCCAAELYDDSSGMHPHRVAELAGAVAIRSGLDAKLSRRIANAARLHDIGKIAVPPAILSKRGPLDEAETEIMQSHTNAGAELLGSANIEDLETVVAVARHHHEWWSGAGYPDRLVGDAIPLAARITAIAEAFDAMTHERPYRSRLSVERALSVIHDRSGRQFDPNLTRLLPIVVHELESSYGNVDLYLQRNAHRSSFLRAQRRLTEQMATAQLSGSLIS